MGKREMIIRKLREWEQRTHRQRATRTVESVWTAAWKAAERYYEAQQTPTRTPISTPDIAKRRHEIESTTDFKMCTCQTFCEGQTNVRCLKNSHDYWTDV